MTSLKVALIILLGSITEMHLSYGEEDDVEGEELEYSYDNLFGYLEVPGFPLMSQITNRPQDKGD